MKTKTPTHAGCIVFRTDNEKKLFLVISSSSGKHWVLPKGHIEKGEKPPDTALRELAEEAGLTGEIIYSVSQQTFMKKGEEVIVEYFLVRMTGRTKPKEERSLRWEDEEKVIETLSFPEAKQAFEEALAFMPRIS